MTSPVISAGLAPSVCLDSSNSSSRWSCLKPCVNSNCLQRIQQKNSNSISSSSCVHFHFRRGRRPAVAVSALPLMSNVPVIGPIVGIVTSPLFLLLAYLVGAGRFVLGFSKTTFSDTFSNRIGLAAIWPGGKHGERQRDLDNKRNMEDLCSTTLGEKIYACDGHVATSSSYIMEKRKQKKEKIL